MSDIPCVIRLSAPFLPPFNIVMGHATSPPSLDDILWFNGWKEVFARRGLLAEDQPEYIIISSDEEGSLEAGDLAKCVANNSIAMEASDESTAAMGKSMGGGYREELSPRGFTEIEEHNYGSTSLREMRMMETARERNVDYIGRKGTSIRRTARKSVPCAASLKKIKFTVE